VALTQLADHLQAQIAALVEDMAPGLAAAGYGLGALTAAQILLSRSHAGRIRSEAAFGMLSGTAPVPVSSGRTDRHRLSRPGGRRLTRALHVIAVRRMRSHRPPRPATAPTRRKQNRPGNPPVHKPLPLYCGCKLT
jgi:transposase